MKVECGMCGRPKPEQAMVAAEDGLLICAKCNREYKDLEDELDQAFEDVKLLLEIYPDLKKDFTTLGRK